MSKPFLLMMANPMTLDPAESICSVFENTLNCAGLSNNDLIDELSEFSDIMPEELARVINRYHVLHELSILDREHLEDFYVNFHSFTYGSDKN